MGKLLKSPKIFVTRQLKHFNKNAFIEALNHVYWDDLLDVDDLTIMVQLWTRVFMGILDRHASVLKCKGKNTYSPWVTSELVRKRCARDVLKTREVEMSSEVLMQAYRNLRNQINHENDWLKHEYFSNKIYENDGHIKGTWNTINKHIDRRSKTTEILHLDVGGEIVSDLKQKVENCNDYFLSAGSALNGRFPANTKPIQTTPEEAKSVFKFMEINIKAVQNSISQLKSKCSFGVDGISSYFLKIAAPVISKSLAKIFNKSLLVGSFPEGWKISKVAPIFKDGVKSEMGNYRPISVLSTVARVFERLVYDQLSYFMEQNKYLLQYQSGFRKFHSTITAMLKTSNDWLLNMDKGLYNWVVFF